MQDGAAKQQIIESRPLLMSHSPGGTGLNSKLRIGYSASLGQVDLCVLPVLTSELYMSHL